MNTITKIEVQKKNRNRYSIFINNKFSFGIYSDTLLKTDLYINKEISNENIENIKKIDSEFSAKDYCLNIISKKMYTEKQIRDKLKNRKDDEKKRKHDDNTIDICIKFLKENELINDLEYAKIRIEGLIENKKYGLKRIKQDLYMKGIDIEIIDSLLEEKSKEENIEDNFYINALNESNKKIKNYSDKGKAFQGILGMLIRKGYDYELSLSVTKQVIEKKFK